MSGVGGAMVQSATKPDETNAPRRLTFLTESEAKGYVDATKNSNPDSKIEMKKEGKYFVVLIPREEKAQPQNTNIRERLFAANPSPQMALGWENARKFLPTGKQAPVKKGAIPKRVASQNGETYKATIVDSQISDEQMRQAQAQAQAQPQQALLAASPALKKDAFAQKLRADLRNSTPNAPRISEEAIKFLSSMYGSSYEREFIFGNLKNAKGLEAWIKENGQTHGLSIQGNFSQKGADGCYHVYVSSKKLAGTRAPGPNRSAQFKTGRWSMGSQSVQEEQAPILPAAASEITAAHSDFMVGHSQVFAPTPYAAKYDVPQAATRAEARAAVIDNLLELARINGINTTKQESDLSALSEEQKIGMLKELPDYFWAATNMIFISGQASMEVFGSPKSKGYADALAKNITVAQTRRDYAVDELKKLLKGELGFKESEDSAVFERNGTKISVITGSVRVGGVETGAQPVELEQFAKFMEKLATTESGQGKIAEWEKKKIISREADGTYSLLDASKFNVEIKKRKEKDPEDPVVAALRNFRGIGMEAAISQRLHISILGKYYQSTETNALVEITDQTKLPAGTRVYIKIKTERELEGGIRFEDLSADVRPSIDFYAPQLQKDGSNSWVRYDNLPVELRSPDGNPPIISKDVCWLGNAEKDIFLSFTIPQDGALYVLRPVASNDEIGLTTNEARTSVISPPAPILPTEKQAELHLRLPQREFKKEKIRPVLSINSENASQFEATFGGDAEGAKKYNDFKANIENKNYSAAADIIASLPNIEGNPWRELKQGVSFETAMNHLRAGELKEFLDCYPEGIVRDSLQIKSEILNILEEMEAKSVKIVQHSPALGLQYSFSRDKVPKAFQPVSLGIRFNYNVVTSEVTFPNSPTFSSKEHFNTVSGTFVMTGPANTILDFNASKSGKSGQHEIGASKTFHLNNKLSLYTRAAGAVGTSGSWNDLRSKDLTPSIEARVYLQPNKYNQFGLGGAFRSQVLPSKAPNSFIADLSYSYTDPKTGIMISPILSAPIGGKERGFGATVMLGIPLGGGLQLTPSYEYQQRRR